MPVAATQPTGKRSKRGRLSEGVPTKKTPEVVAKIAHAISLGLTDEEAGGYAGISGNLTLTTWRKDPEFLRKIKDAVATRLVLRLSRIESGVDGWQGSAWLAERLMPSRYSKPEVQLNLIQQNNVTENRLSITISEQEIREIEDAASPERERVRKMFEGYRSGAPGNGNGKEQRTVDVQAEPVKTESEDSVCSRTRSREVCSIPARTASGTIADRAKGR
jgi:hypothetical protein